MPAGRAQAAEAPATAPAQDQGPVEGHHARGRAWPLPPRPGHRRVPGARRRSVLRHGPPGRSEQVAHPPARVRHAAGPDIEDPPASDGQVLAHPQARARGTGGRGDHGPPGRRATGPQARPAAAARSPPPQAPPGPRPRAHRVGRARCRCARWDAAARRDRRSRERRPARRDQRAGHRDVHRSSLPRPRRRRRPAGRGLERDLGGARSRDRVARRRGGRGRAATRGVRPRSGRSLPVGAVPAPERRRLRGRRARLPRGPPRRQRDHAVERGQSRCRADRRPPRSRCRLLQRSAAGLRELHARGRRHVDGPGMLSWLAEYRRALAEAPKVWGLHDYYDTTYFRTTGLADFTRAVSGQVWLTETGGIVELRSRDGSVSLPRDELRARASVSFAFETARAFASRVGRLYLYQWQADPRAASTPDCCAPTAAPGPHSTSSARRSPRSPGLAAPRAPESRRAGRRAPGARLRGESRSGPRASPRSACAVRGRRRAVRRPAVGRGRGRSRASRWSTAGSRSRSCAAEPAVRGACRARRPAALPGAARRARMRLGAADAALRLMVTSRDEPFALRGRYRADAWRAPERLSPRRRAR